MARDEVFGMRPPQAATIATTIGVVRFPASPPTQCLSSTRLASQRSRSPTSTMASVSCVISAADMGRAAHAVRNADSSTWVRAPSTTSRMMVRNSPRPSDSPYTFERMSRADSGESA